MKGIQVALIGSLTREPDPIRESATGKRYRTLNLGVFDGSEPEWVKVTAWGDDLDRFDGLKKGAEVYVEGRIRLSRWTGNDGIEKSALQVAAWRVEPLGQIGRRATSGTTAATRKTPPSRRNWTPPFGFEEAD